MLAVGAAVLLAGYSLMFWGNRIRTGNRVSFADVVLPGHYQSGPLPEPSAASAGPIGGGPPAAAPALPPSAQRRAGATVVPGAS